MKQVKIQLWTVRIKRIGKSPRYVNPCSHIDKEGLEQYALVYNVNYGPNFAEVVPYEERRRYEGNND